MRRWIAAALTASAVAVATPAFAQAAPKGPVEALQQQFVAGQGVQLKETTRSTLGKEEFLGASRTGVVQFDAKGVAAAQSKRTPVLSAELKALIEEAATKEEPLADMLSALFDPTHTVSVDGTLYMNGTLLNDILPDHRTWVRARPVSNATAVYGDQLINVFEPATLKTLLAGAKDTKGPLYSGSITFAQLHAVSPTFRDFMQKPKGAAAKLTVKWRIVVGADHLVKRLKTAWSIPVLKKVMMSASVDTHYYDWGSQVAVTAPSPHEVIDAKDLAKIPPPNPALIDRNYVSTPPADDVE